MSFDGGCAGSPVWSLRHGRRAVGEDRSVCVGLDTHKAKIAVAVAEPGRSGEVRFRGEIANRPEAVRQLLERLAEKHGRLRVGYEAGPCGYGLHRQIIALGHDCTVVAPSLIPRKPGERVKMPGGCTRWRGRSGSTSAIFTRGWARASPPGRRPSSGG